MKKRKWYLCVIN